MTESPKLRRLNLSLLIGELDNKKWFKSAVRINASRAVFTLGTIVLYRAHRVLQASMKN